MTSLHEINKLIRNKIELVDEIEEAQIRAKLPFCYHDYWDVFSKKASDTLLPSWFCNPRMELEKENTLRHLPLYNKQSSEEPETDKQNIVHNLKKGFIVPSSAPFASLILIAQKANRGLRFCVDYRKLNALPRRIDTPSL